MNEIDRLKAEVKSLKEQLSQCLLAKTTGAMMPPVLADESVTHLPILSPLLNLCGVYFLTRNGTVVYVGKSIDLISRASNHKWNRGELYDSVWFMPCAVDQLDKVERYWIRLLQPEVNRQFIKETYILSPMPPLTRKPDEVKKRMEFDEAMVSVYAEQRKANKLLRTIA